MTIAFELQQEMKDVHLAQIQEQRNEDTRRRMQEDSDEYDEELEDDKEVTPLHYRRR